uniref:Glycosyltransferase 8 domain containing 2 n=1 Tax=Nothobranchius furzeri TaxID=105023 RepID=A0A8C6KQF9_NOTFU
MPAVLCSCDLLALTLSLTPCHFFYLDFLKYEHFHPFSVNQVLLVLLLLLLWLLLHATLQRASSQPRQGASNQALSEDDNVVPVVICASEERMGATMATINSIISNTDTSVFFYVVTLRDAVKLIRFDACSYEPLKGEARLFSLNFVRFYLPLLGISHKRVIYLDDDVIVQGDIRDLYDVKLKAGHAAAFATDCDLPSTHEMVRSIGMQTTYMGFLDYRKQEVKDLGISPSDCSFNPGVFVADITEWTKQKVTKQKNIYSSAMAGGVATPPMLIVFHDKYTTLDPLWHVRHLGWSPDARYSDGFLQEAHLLHWNGPFKPWNYPAVHLDLWERWFVPDPSGRFLLSRPERDS